MPPRRRRRGSGAMSRRTAILLLAGGFGMTGAAYGSGAYSSVEGFRPSAVDTVADPDALFGLRYNDEPAEPPEFTNRRDDPITVTLSDPGAQDLQFRVDDEGDMATTPVTFTLEGGESRVAEVNGNAEEVDVHMLATSDVTADETEMTREFVVPQAEQVQFEEEVLSSGNSGSYEVKITNRGDIDVGWIGIAVVDTSQEDAYMVSDGKNNNRPLLQWLDPSPNQRLYDPDQPQQPDDESTPGMIKVGESAPTLFNAEETNISISPDEDVIFEFDRFTTEDREGVDMQLQSVESNLIFEDNSTTLEFVDEDKTGHG